jgi:hypothetical protein
MTSFPPFARRFSFWRNRLHFSSSSGVAGGSAATRPSENVWPFKVVRNLTDPPGKPEDDEFKPEDDEFKPEDDEFKPEDDELGRPIGKMRTAAVRPCRGSPPRSKPMPDKPRLQRMTICWNPPSIAANHNTILLINPSRTTGRSGIREWIIPTRCAERGVGGPK